MSYYPLTTIPDYYGIDALLTEEHKLIRQSIRDWVESFVMPKIDQAAQDHTDLPGLMKELGKIGRFRSLYSRRIWRFRFRSDFLWFNHAGIRKR